MDRGPVRGINLGLCAVCGRRPAIYFRKYSGERLCSSCFKDDFIKRIRRTISRYDLLRYDDKIVVAVSGGKDSLALLRSLYKIEREFPRASLIPLSIDEGIDHYREESLKIAEEFVESLGLELHRLSFKELYGFTLKEAVEAGAPQKLNLHPCTICGVLRRKALVIGARRLGATIIATAHTLDDIVQTYLLNLLRGESNIRPVGLRREMPGVIPRVAPLRLIPQAEVALYAYLEGIPFQTIACPYTRLSMRDEVRNFLTLYGEKYPGSLYAFLNSFERLIEKIPRLEENRCMICGEPTNREICRACEISLAVKNLLKN